MSNKFEFPKFCGKVHTSSFLCLEEKLTTSNDFLHKQSIALEILYRSVSLRIDLKSTFKATEVTIGQGLYSRLEDFR